MAALEIQQKSIMLFLVVSLVVLPKIVQWSAASTLSSCTTKNTNSRHDVSLDFFESTIVRYMSEIGSDSPLVNMIIQAAAAEPGNFGETIIKRSANFEIPMMLFLLDELAEKTMNLTVFQSPQTCRACSKFKHVIAIFHDTEAVKPENWRILYDEIWNPAANFLILINDVSFDLNSADRLLRNFWSLDCANVVIASADSSTNETIGRIYGYDPFFVETTKMVQSNATRVKRGIVFVVKSSDSLFTEKFKNLRGHDIETSLYRHRPHATLIPTTSDLSGATGFDVELLRYTATWLNFTISLRTGEAGAASHVVSLPDGKKTGPIGDILTGKSDYLANGQFLEILQLYNRSLDYVYPRWRSHSVVVVRRESALPALILWLRAAGNERRQRRRRALLVLLAASLALLSLIIYLRVLKRRNGGQIFLAIVGLVIFQRLPKIGHLTSERIFCFILIYCSFVVCTVYQGNLLNDLSSPPVFDDIDTISDLVERTDSLRLMVRPYERRILESWASEDITRRKLYDRTLVSLNFSACLGQMRDARNVACSIDKSYGEYALGQVRRYELMLKKNPETRVIGNARGYLMPPIHIIDESLMDFWKTYFVRRDFPYLRMINEAITRSVEFGIADKWLRDDRKRYFREPEASNEPRSLGLKRMDYTFAVLIIGHVIAALVFFSEIALAIARRSFSTC